MGRLAAVHSVQDEQAVSATVLALAEFARATYGGPVLVVDASAPWPSALAQGLGCESPRTLEELARLGNSVTDAMLASLFVVPRLAGIEFVQLAQGPSHYRALTPERAAEWLGRLRQRYDHAVVHAGTHLTAWTLAALSSADLTVELAPAGGRDYERVVELLTVLRAEEFSAERVVVVGLGENGHAPGAGDPAQWVGYDVSAAGTVAPGAGPTIHLVRDLFDRFVRVRPLTAPSLVEGAWTGHSAEKERRAEGRGQPAPPTTDEESALDVLRRRLHQELVTQLNLKHMGPWWDDPEAKARLRTEAQRVVSINMDRLGGGSLSRAQRQRIVTAVLNEAFGLGPLELLVAQDDITEIMVNGPRTIYIERQGRVERSAERFTDQGQLMNVIDRIVAPLGRRVDESSPYVDARLADGSRVNIIIPPLALNGPLITIRKFRAEPMRVQDLLNFGSLSRQMADFLQLCVVHRKNIMISGGTGTGKTTLLNVLSDYIPADERIVTIEDSAELRLLQPHVCSLEARPANIQGQGMVTIRDLVRNALRMRPDRIVVGECRGPEALDMLQAMNTGHDGALSTVHANSTEDALRRLETLCLFSGLDLPGGAIRAQIASAIDFIVQLTRFHDGARRVTCIGEVVPEGEGGHLRTRDIFTHSAGRTSTQGLAQAPFQPTGVVPTFVEALTSAGTYVPRELFQPAGF